MRRMMSAAVPVKLASILSQQRPHSHSHSHSHGHGHGHSHHSHAAIEKELEGANLRQCQIATLVGGTTNIFFCVTKLYVGSSGGSVALVADGFHALTDIVADVISYASISLAKKKLPRCRFPFGIGRLETSGAVFVAAILLIGGVMLLIQSFQSFARDLGLLSIPSAATHDGHSHPHHEHSHAHGGAAHGHSHFEVTVYDATTGKQEVMWTMAALAAASVVCKELLFHWTRRVGKKAGSRVVVANAYHHRADAWSGAVALTGVVGQMMGIPGMDGIAGLVVSLSICQIGYSLFRDSVLEFFDFQNAEEVAQLRDRLQDFHLRVLRDGAVMTERNQLVGSSFDERGSGAAAEALDSVLSNGLQESKIRYVNVFLMRHGHSYALHLQLLVHETQTAVQIQEATEQLQKLAKESLPIRETFISLLVCSPQTVPRAEYYRVLYKSAFGVSPSEAGHSHGSGDGHEHSREHSPGTETAAAPAVKPASRPLPTASAADIDEREMFIAAEGELVNPSLERCLRSISEFHGFTKPIRYSWENRTVTTPKASSCECSRDVESVAKIFNCRLIVAEGLNREECHGHSHEHRHK